MHGYAREEKKLFGKKPFQKDQKTEALPNGAEKTSTKPPADTSKEKAVQTSTLSAEAKTAMTLEDSTKLSDRDLLLIIYHRINKREGKS